jgi:hypothetical protein
MEFYDIYIDPQIIEAFFSYVLPLTITVVTVVFGLKRVVGYLLDIVYILRPAFDDVNDRGVRWLARRFKTTPEHILEIIDQFERLLKDNVEAVR